MIFNVRTRTGATMPNLGLGTWRMGENAAARTEEVAALKLGLELGLALLDTAEMYGRGGAERVVAEAIEGERDDVFLVSKVLPHNASYQGTIAACEGSLSRLRTDHLDLYLLHWPGEHPVEETLRAFTTLTEQGKILHYGLSNFDRDELERAGGLRGGIGIGVNQVLYNVGRRGIERRLIPWCASKGIAVMAYSPLEQGRLRSTAALRRVAERHDATPAQIALAWTLRHENVVAIPKAAKRSHVRDNARAADIVLTEQDLADIDAAYPPPSRDVPLETL
ncbi:MAG TPA: aldo/keto reductase [Candidatus Polarisedimenticolaceae bacterium]|nr:aldo/keto reductase [Candidatus Polarisedimenticolaceae bacterium]